MKIRDLLVIAFTAIVALLLFMRSAIADRSPPEDSARESGGGESEHVEPPSEGPESAPTELAGDPDRRRPAPEGESSSPASDAADGPTQKQSLGCSASPGAVTATLLNSLAALVAVGLVARRRR